VIYAHKPVVVYNGSNVTVVFQKGEKIVSLALDDSCGALDTLRRGSIELFRQPDPEDKTSELCTHEVWPEQGSVVVVASMENFERALRWMSQSNWGFDAQTPSRWDGLPVFK